MLVGAEIQLQSPEREREREREREHRVHYTRLRVVLLRSRVHGGVL